MASSSTAAAASPNANKDGTCSSFHASNPTPENERNSPAPTAAIAAVDAECRKCLDRLTVALRQPRTTSLLRAMGCAVEPDTGAPRYERTEEGNGIRIALPPPPPPQTAAAAEKQEHDGPKLIGATDGRRDGMSNGAGGGGSSSSLASLLARRLSSAAASAIGTSPLHVPPPGSTCDENDDPSPLSPVDDGISIECVPCGSTGPEANARAFVGGPTPLFVALCSNRLSSQRELNEALVHELIHVYDARQRRFDLRSCRQLAHSEVRAAREAECSGSYFETTRGYCAKEKARVATTNMFPGAVGAKCVCDVFESAMADRAPFDEQNRRADGAAGEERGGNSGKSNGGRGLPLLFRGGSVGGSGKGNGEAAATQSSTGDAAWRRPSSSEFTPNSPSSR